MLVWALLLMGTATFAIGLLPELLADWHLGADAAHDAPVHPGIRARRRMGRRAVLMSVEHAPAAGRGLFGSFVALGVPAGLRAGQSRFSSSHVVHR